MRRTHASERTFFSGRSRSRNSSLTAIKGIVRCFGPQPEPIDRSPKNTNRKTRYNRRNQPGADDMTTKILAALFLAFALAGCGQSGPLFIPGDPSSIEGPQQQQSEEENDEDNGDSNSQ